MSHRVVITGVGLCTPIGHDLDTVSAALQAGRGGVRAVREWPSVHSIQPAVGAPVQGIEFGDYPRKRVRTMGRVSLLATYATERALADAGTDRQALGSGRVGLAHGSTYGSSSEMEAWCRQLFQGGEAKMKGLPGSSFLKFMSHTTAANLAEYFGVRGRVQPTCSACTSASQAVGLAYEYVRAGIQDSMIAGGAEELHFTHAGVFDLMYAASHRFNDAPDRTPRPFDRDRDGVVVGEGAATFVLERRDHAMARGANIHAEIRGYATNCDGIHLTNPSWEGMAACMASGLESAGVTADELDYINAHGTGTELGDIAESRATAKVVGAKIPVSTQKSFVGHTLGACGTIEMSFVIAMMRDAFLAHNRTLEHIDPRCADLDYIMGEPRAQRPRLVLCNNFAFGGINTSVVLEAP